MTYGWEDTTEHEAEMDARDAWNDDYGQETCIPPHLFDYPDVEDEDDPDRHFLTMSEFAEAMTDNFDWNGYILGFPVCDRCLGSGFVSYVGDECHVCKGIGRVVPDLKTRQEAMA